MTQSPIHAGTASASGIDATIALSLISSEVGHEVVQALNYLRFLVKNTQSGHLAPEILGFAVAEIERLTRLVQHLRQFRLPPLVLTEVALADRVEQTLSGLCDVTADVKWTLEVPRHMVLHTDAAFLAGALRSLASHALGHAPPGSAVTVRAAASNLNREEEISVEVVDCGPPLSDPSPRALFDVWTLHTPDSQPARRAIAHRLLRHLGSTLTYEHTGGSNVFRFSLPQARGTA